MFAMGGTAAKEAEKELRQRGGGTGRKMRIRWIESESDEGTTKETYFAWKGKSEIPGSKVLRLWWPLLASCLRRAAVVRSSISTLPTMRGGYQARRKAQRRSFSYPPVPYFDATLGSLRSKKKLYVGHTT